MMFLFIFSQECIFKKLSDNTALRVSWTGALRIYNCDSCCSRWYFTFNGAECSAPAAIDGAVYMRYGSGSRLKNLHRIAYVILKEFVRKSTKAQCVLDSGSANVPVRNLLMLTQVGPECPGFTWKKYLPHRLDNSRFRFSSSFKRD